MNKKHLYVWNWTEGGFNQVNATSRADALDKARKLGQNEAGRCKLTVEESTLRQLNEAEAKAYWDNLPLMD